MPPLASARSAPAVISHERSRWLGRVPGPLLAVAAALGLLCASARAAAPPTLAPEQLRPGDLAIVRTVFRGDSIEEFPAEIVGVLSPGKVEGQIIIARATSDRVKQMGVAQGMSGSPVYVGGRLVGALSSSWSFEREALFGVTPIREMLEVLDYPPVPTIGPASGPAGIDMAAGSAGPPGTEAPLRWEEFRWSDEPGAPVEARSTTESRSAPDPREGLVPGAPLALPLPLACAGLDPAAYEQVRGWLEPFGLAAVPAGVTTRGPRGADLEPGSAVAVDLLRGDLRLSAIGTLTWRDGDRVLLFGHPFFQSGDVRLPLSTADITTVVSSSFVSFKLGSAGREVGEITQDRHSAVAGLIGPRARLLPLAIHVAGTLPRPRDYRFEMVPDRALAAPLASAAILNSLLESGGSGASQTVRWKLALGRRGSAPLILGDAEAGENPATEAANAISAPLAFLLGNPYASLPLDSVRISIDVAPGRDQWTLVSARLLDAAVRPGGIARIECQVQRWRGPTETRVIEIPVAGELPEGRYTVWVGGGAELNRFEAQKFPARYRPTSLEDAWQRFAHVRASTALYAVITASAPDVTANGRDYPELPASAAAVLASGLAAGVTARRADAALLDETRLPFSGEVRGDLQLVLTVDDNAP